MCRAKAWQLGLDLEPNQAITTRGSDLADRASINDAAFDYYERLARVREYVTENLTDHITLASAASVACLSPSYFSSFFRRAVGVPFTAWRRQMQIQLATELLANRNRSVAEVAQATGFRTGRTFERWFRRYVGVSPQAFRLQRRPERRRQAEAP